MNTAALSLDFRLPEELAAHEPPEARGLTRDQVRLLVSRLGDDSNTHTRFTHLPDFLAPGDVLVVNDSATIKAALRAIRETAGGIRHSILIHLSVPLSPERWVIELRDNSVEPHFPLLDAEVGDRLRLQSGGTAVLIEPFSTAPIRETDGIRLWVAEFAVTGGVESFFATYGAPIRYGYVPREWPLDFYQSVFASDPGSAEMPSAGRPFTRALLDRLVLKGVDVTPVTLHTGVSSLDDDEAPFAERFRVRAGSARRVNDARSRGDRVIAVGTTVVRALESAADLNGVVHAVEGWTDLVITPERGLRVIDGMLTGFHAPRASHLWMLEALAGPDRLWRAYEEALTYRYLWHEFGDVHLLVP